MMVMMMILKMILKFTALHDILYPGMYFFYVLTNLYLEIFHVSFVFFNIFIEV